MGKFRFGSQFWKHSNCKDVFFAVERVQDDELGANAVLYGCWIIQGVFHFWPATFVERVHIEPDQYHNWKPYEPQGDLYV